MVVNHTVVEGRKKGSPFFLDQLWLIHIPFLVSLPRRYFEKNPSWDNAIEERKYGSP
jgi:hypothetical protein